MSWKPSKRQAQLKQRLIHSSRVYWETSHSLDQMLLKMLHNNDVYTPDDFYDKYIKSNHKTVKNWERCKAPNHHFPLDKNNGGKGVDNSKQSINRTLSELDQVLHQLRHIVNND